MEVPAAAEEPVAAAPEGHSVKKLEDQLHELEEQSDEVVDDNANEEPSGNDGAVATGGAAMWGVLVKEVEPNDDGIVEEAAGPHGVFQEPADEALADGPELEDQNSKAELTRYKTCEMELPEGVTEHEIRETSLEEDNGEEGACNWTEVLPKNAADDGLPDVSHEPGSIELPPEISKSVKVLHVVSEAPGGQCTVYIVGTAHVSQESCREVEAVIRYIRPQVVFVELCMGRGSMLLPQSLHVPTLREMLDMWKSKKMNAFGIIYSWFLAKIAQRMEVFPGAEFRVAFEEGKACGATIILGDRPVHITLQRTWANMSFWHKTKLIYYMLSQAVFLPSVEELNKMLTEMSDTDMVTLVIQELSKTFPTLMDTLLTERDLFMTAVLQKLSQSHSSIVCVIGKGHVAGIMANWDKSIKVDALLEVPRKKSSKKYWALGFAVSAVAVGIGVYLGRTRSTTS